MIRISIDTLLVMMFASAVIGGMIHYAAIHGEELIAGWRYRRQLKKEEKKNKLTEKK